MVEDEEEKEKSDVYEMNSNKQRIRGREEKRGMEEMKGSKLE